MARALEVLASLRRSWSVSSLLRTLFCATAIALIASRSLVGAILPFSAPATAPMIGALPVAESIGLLKRRLGRVITSTQLS